MVTEITLFFENVGIIGNNPVDAPPFVPPGLAGAVHRPYIHGLSELVHFADEAPAAKAVIHIHALPVPEIVLHYMLIKAKAHQRQLENNELLKMDMSICFGNVEQRLLFKRMDGVGPAFGMTLFDELHHPFFNTRIIIAAPLDLDQ